MNFIITGSRVWNGKKPIDPIPGEWFCCNCMYHAPKEEFFVKNYPECPKSDCEVNDVFDAWTDPTRFEMPARLEHPPESGAFFCTVCGELRAKEDDFRACGTIYMKYLCRCGDQFGVRDATEVWEEQVHEFGERGVVYDPEKGWCNRT